MLHAILAPASTTNSNIENNTIQTGSTTGAAINTNASTGVRVRNNRGYVTEAEGATSVADGGTITHGLATTPIVVTVSPRTAGELASVTARSHYNLHGSNQNSWRSRRNYTNRRLEGINIGCLPILISGITLQMETLTYGIIKQRTTELLPRPDSSLASKTTIQNHIMEALAYNR